MDVQGWVVVGLAFVLFGYLVPHLVQSRHQLAQARVEDRFSGTLRVVTTGAAARRPSPGEHHGVRESRPYLHDPRRRTEAPAVNRPTTPSERAAAEARRLAATRAARAAEISRRKAAARRRLVLTVLLLLASVGGWLAFGVASASVVLGIVPTVLLTTVLVLGRRAAKIAARRNAADRAAMARLQVRPAARTRPEQGNGARPAGAGASRAHGATTGETTTGAATTGSGATAAGAEPTVAHAPAVGDDVAVTAGTGGDATATTDAAAATAGTGRDATATTDAAAAVDADAVAEESSVPQLADTERGWTPVPVPAPSYTLKAPAPRRDIAPYEAPAQEPVAAEAAVEHAVTSGLAGSPYAPVLEPELVAPQTPDMPPARGLDLDSVLARRRAVGA
ncbi:hypothetical protein [Georgenia sp. H159]|uniref:hypothetical protein n=1 Tax=Georgenia sp. H159 TaxID=3076115 RepID=UPI002D787780|nr:hypothetical protein [Georgenia sp. H159]